MTANTDLFNVISLKELDSELDRQQWLELAAKYRAWRLYALKTNPEAFGAMYQDEAERSIEFWVERLKGSKAVHFVGIPEDESETADTLSAVLNRKWYGCLVLLGPQTSVGSISARVDPHARMTIEQSSESSTLHYHLNGMFVLPEARGIGLAMTLMAHVLDYAEREAKAASKDAVITILVDENNPAACRLYRKVGFEVIDRMPYTKKLVQEDRTREEEWIALNMQMRRYFAK